MRLPLNRHAVAVKFTGSAPGSVDYLSDSLKFVFSWIALLPIAIVVSGKLIAHNPAFKLSGQDEQKFGLRLPGIIHFVATGDEVVFGFALFITEFFFFALVAGRAIYGIVKSDFGVDLGQFNSLCAFSAFSSVIVSGLVLLFIALNGTMRGKNDPVLQEHASELDRLTRGRGPVTRKRRGANSPAAHGGGK